MRSSKYTRESLAPIVAANTSVRGMLQSLGLQPTGGNYRRVNQWIKAFELDRSHFTGLAWNKGKDKTHPSIAAYAGKLRIPDEEVFKLGSTYPPSKLGRRLLTLGWKYACAICSLTEWLGKLISLHVDHKNGNTSDNRLENLRFLCPNCHQQTGNWGSLNRHGVVA